MTLRTREPGSGQGLVAAKGCALLTMTMFVGLPILPAEVAAESAPPHETIAPQFTHVLSNVPGKSFTSVIVSFLPGAKANPHRHGDAFVYAYVLEGSVRSQIDNEPARVYRQGEDWFEPPRARHTTTENTSQVNAARLLVMFITNTGTPLKIPDQP